VFSNQSLIFKRRIFLETKAEKLQFLAGLGTWAGANGGLLKIFKPTIKQIST